MYAYIKGKLTHSHPSYAVVEANGVGYQIMIPASTFSELPALNKEVLLYTSLVIREHLQALYGFMRREEKELFERVTTVSGIGPKIGLALIGHLPLSDLYLAINNNDYAAISRVPGIGKKTAQRLVIEMRDKFAGLEPEGFAIKIERDPKMQKLSDAMQALVNLGYNQSSAQKAVKKVVEENEGIELSDLITCALREVR